MQRLPADFCNTNFALFHLEKRVPFVLIDEHLAMWKVQYIPDKQCISAGWGTFAKMHRLQVDDIVHFRLINCQTFQVGTWAHFLSFRLGTWRILFSILTQIWRFDYPVTIFRLPTYSMQNSTGWSCTCSWKLNEEAFSILTQMWWSNSRIIFYLTSNHMQTSTGRSCRWQLMERLESSKRTEDSPTHYTLALV